MPVSQNIKSAMSASGEAPVFGCRAWANINGVGTPTIRGSGNVSSITDNGVGDYTVNFAKGMEDNFYCAVVGMSEQNVYTHMTATQSMLSTSIRISCKTSVAGENQVPVLTDAATVHVAIFR